MTSKKSISVRVMPRTKIILARVTRMRLQLLNRTEGICARVMTRTEGISVREIRMLHQLVGFFSVERACMKLDVFFKDW
jgi:hypothetical protein